MNISPARRAWVGLVGLLVASVSAVIVVADEPQRPTFSAGTDLIAVDVQVVNSDGAPVAGLGLERFEVSINRKRRRVVSADLLRFDESGGAAAVPPVPTTVSVPGLAEAGEGGRVYILAVDVMSFHPSAARDILGAAQNFVRSLQPTDLVGVFAYPNEQPIEITTNHAAVTRDLDRVIGRSAPLVTSMNRYQLMPSDIIDLTALRARDPREPPSDPELKARISEICSGDRDDPVTCQRTVVPEAHALAAFEESQVVQRLSALRSMLAGLAVNPRRKTVVLLSTGILATDRPGGRPDLEDLGVVIGQDAARANATIYTLHVDRRQDTMSASSPRRPRPYDNASRDAAILARPLDQIAGASGGAMLTVVQGGESAFARVMRETSAYYLLGVEPDQADRDGKPRALSVKVNTGQRGSSVRARSWVVVPRK